MATPLLDERAKKLKSMGIDVIAYCTNSGTWTGEVKPMAQRCRRLMSLTMISGTTMPQQVNSEMTSTQQSAISSRLLSSELMMTSQYMPIK